MIYKCVFNDIIVYIEADDEKEALIKAKRNYGLNFKEVTLVQD